MFQSKLDQQILKVMLRKVSKSLLIAPSGAIFLSSFFDKYLNYGIH